MSDKTEETKEDVDILKKNNLEMRVLKNRDLPKMIKIIKKLNLKVFIKEAINESMNNDISVEDHERLKEIRNHYEELKKGKKKEEKEEIDKQMLEEQRTFLEELKGAELVKLLNPFLENIIENYDVAYNEINDFLGGLYDIKNTEVEDLDLDVFLACFYNLRKQDKLINFFKLALK